MLIDTHAHVNFAVFREDANKVVERALKENVWIINIGSQYETSKRAVEIAERYPEGVYAAVALHPIHLGPSKVIDEQEEEPLLKFKTREEEFDKEKYRELAKNPKVVAIGETGLDYYYAEADKPRTDISVRGKRGSETRINADKIKKLQKEVFKKHLELAKELDKPVIFHCRKAYNDLLEILKSKIYNPKSNLKGVLHCFMGKWSQAEQFLEMGFYLGFNGLITYCRDYDKVIKNIPLEKILVETDCPYLSPEPHRGERNEPLYVKFVAQKIAEIKGIDFEEVAKQTTKNARELFRI